MVAIKDFGMPSCCMNCEMQIDGLSAGYYCAITEEELNDNSTLKQRHPNCPLVEIGERKQGEWLFTKTIFDKFGCTVECFSCHKKWKTYDEIRWKKENKYCPNCGAEMRGAENG